MVAGARHPRWQSVLKWIGLYLLAQLIGGFTAGFFLGRDSGADSLLSAAIFLAMILYTAVRGWLRRRRAVAAPALTVVLSRRPRRRRQP